MFGPAGPEESAKHYIVSVLCQQQELQMTSKTKPRILFPPFIPFIKINDGHHKNVINILIQLVFNLEC